MKYHLEIRILRVWNPTQKYTTKPCRKHTQGTGRWAETVNSSGKRSELNYMQSKK